MIRTSALLLCLFLALAMGLSFWAYNNSLRRELAALQAAGEVRLSEASSRLRLQIDEYRALANVIADEPRISQAMLTGELAAIEETLIDFELKYGAWRVDLTDLSGSVVASSGRQAVRDNYPKSLIGAALNGRLGFALVQAGGNRFVDLSRSITGPERTRLGTVVVRVDLAALEFEWPVTPEPLVFIDAAKFSISANRPSLLFLTQGRDPAAGTIGLVPLGHQAGADLWNFAPPDDPPREVVMLSQFVPQLGLTGQIFLATEPARATARVRLLLALALTGVLGLIAAVAAQQRRRWEMEARHTATLEARVEARTKELKEAQSELVEASKLTALGRLSAGISHELNQPLGAILNFAETGPKFLDRDNPEQARKNFQTISDQVRRITRIIGNLRAFARQEVTPTEEIDFVDVVRSSLLLLDQEIAQAGVDLHVQLPQAPLHVVAGRVRLEQVLLNLIKNAIDAMAQAGERCLTVELSSRQGNAILTVQDTGHGIKDVDRVFEPFYTTKDLGASKGLGMGLSLSFGIITRFGGQLSCQNLKEGAEFQVQLPIAEGADD